MDTNKFSWPRRQQPQAPDLDERGRTADVGDFRYAAFTLIALHSSSPQ
jgi:hypothetical protein